AVAELDGELLDERAGRHEAAPRSHVHRGPVRDVRHAERHGPGPDGDDRQDQDLGLVRQLHPTLAHPQHSSRARTHAEGGAEDMTKTPLTARDAGWRSTSPPPNRVWPCSS